MSNWKPTTKAKRDLKTYFRLHGVDEKDCERAANALITWSLVAQAYLLMPTQGKVAEIVDEAAFEAVGELADIERAFAKKYTGLPADFIYNAQNLVPEF